MRVFISSAFRGIQALVNRIGGRQARSAQVAKTDAALAARKRTVEKLKDQAALEAVIATDADPNVREEAVRRLRDEAVLARVAKTDPAKQVR